MSRQWQVKSTCKVTRNVQQSLNEIKVVQLRIFVTLALTKSVTYLPSFKTMSIYTNSDKPKSWNPDVQLFEKLLELEVISFTQWHSNRVTYRWIGMKRGIRYIYFVSSQTTHVHRNYYNHLFTSCVYVSPIFQRNKMKYSYRR